ncbi:hypothetical protein PVBG_03438 [Plasmodium vivax Brazil I]|uniref:Uncharacterized protein n=1 Tax=Plasmodium vivax (strain Brazil I) TaxID=1033975 RepID=A0A0J9VH31_PLAV1|nr:hypothetical protein PVBG_03438 [Plasmodium vivax Brazil I]
MKAGRNTDSEKEALGWQMEKSLKQRKRKNSHTDAVGLEHHGVAAVERGEAVLASGGGENERMEKRKVAEKVQKAEKTEKKDRAGHGIPRRSQSASSLGSSVMAEARSKRGDIQVSREDSSEVSSQVSSQVSREISHQLSREPSGEVGKGPPAGYEYDLGIDNDVENEMDDEYDDDMNSHMNDAPFELCESQDYENGVEENNTKGEGSAKKNLRDNSGYTDTEVSYVSEMDKIKLDAKNDCCCCFARRGKKFSSAGVSDCLGGQHFVGAKSCSEANPCSCANICGGAKNGHGADRERGSQKRKKNASSELKNASSELKNMDWLIYTIRYMDYRRLRRRFNGIRKPISKKIVFIITIFCLILISWKYFKTSYENSMLTISFKVQTSFLFFVEAALAIIGVIIFAKFQTRLSLHWPIYASYIFIICASILLIFYEKDKNDKISRGEHILMIYGLVQLSLIIIVKIIICIGPLLAIYGFFCPCTEHCRILKKKIATNKLNITISRYNDFAGMCGNNFCCLCLCAYRSFYRIVNCFYKKFSNLRFKMTNDSINEAPFSHQLRYKGKTDIYGRPHGYGEWIEDHSYGEKLRGFWFHGYPVGPFISQEVGSGSLFVNTRVGFAACVGKDWSDVRYGVSCTECSISGHFFNDFPLTYFFDPKIEKDANGRLPTNRYDIIVKDILKENYEDILGYDLKWCFNMLKVNSSTTTEYFSNNCMISIDHVTMSLKVHNYKRLGPVKGRNNNILDEITVKLVHLPKVKKGKKIYKRNYPYRFSGNGNHAVLYGRPEKQDEQVMKGQEGEEFFYSNQNKIHNSIKKLSAHGNQNCANELKEDSYHSYYTHKLSDKLLDSVNDDIYLYKMNKSIKSTEMHKAPYLFDRSGGSTTPDEDAKRGTYRIGRSLNSQHCCVLPHRSSYCGVKGKHRNRQIGVDSRSDSSPEVHFGRRVNHAGDTAKLPNERERRRRAEKSTRRRCHVPPHVNLFTEDSATKSNSSFCRKDDTFVVNINGFGSERRCTERRSTRGLPVGAPGRGTPKKEGRKKLRRREPRCGSAPHGEGKKERKREGLRCGEKELLCGNVLRAKFREHHAVGLEREGSDVNEEKVGRVSRPRERPPSERPPSERPPSERPPSERPPSERPPNERRPTERRQCKADAGRDPPSRATANEAHHVQQSEAEGSSPKRQREGEKRQKKNKNRVTLPNEQEKRFEEEAKKSDEVGANKSDEVKWKERTVNLKDTSSGTSNFGENKALFISDIFKSFIKAGVARNSRGKNVKKNSSDEREDTKQQTYTDKRKKNKKSKRCYSNVNKGRKEIYNKTMKKGSLHRMKNSKIKGFVKRYTRQYRKGSIYITSNKNKIDKFIRSKYNSNSKNTQIIGTLGDTVKSINESFGSLNGANLSSYNMQRNKTIAQVFAEEDEWENYRHQHKEKIIVDGWQSLSLKQNLNFMPDEIVIYIHGYNVKLHHGCSQLAHLVSFSKLPSYIQPFVFHWEGYMWGAFSALSYPVARKRSEMAVLGNSFKTFIRELINSGIKNVHIISHSCGSRLFFNGFASCVEDNLFYNVLKNEKSAGRQGGPAVSGVGGVGDSGGVSDASDVSHIRGASPPPHRRLAASATGRPPGKKRKKKKNKQMIVKTVILLNPDYPLDKFLEKDFFVLRSHCNHIVMYGDTRDQALTYSETWNREKCLGKRIFKLKLPLYKIYNCEDYLNLNLDRSNFLTGNYEDKYKMCDNVLFPNSSYVEEKMKLKQSQRIGEQLDRSDKPHQRGKENEREESHPQNKSTHANANTSGNDHHVGKTIRKTSTYDYDEGASCISEDLAQNYLNENFLKTVEFSDSSLRAFTSKRRFKISKAFKKIKRKWLFKNKKKHIYFNQNSINRPNNIKMKERVSKTSAQTSKKTDTVYISFDKYAWLDMDVIDTTFVETNVDFLKHSFYQVKREIIDDIREVLISNIPVCFVALNFLPFRRAADLMFLN